MRAAQERLHDLGYLADADFTAEQADPLATANLTAAALAHTIAAIQALQTTLAAEHAARAPEPAISRERVFAISNTIVIEDAKSNSQ